MNRLPSHEAPNTERTNIFNAKENSKLAVLTETLIPLSCTHMLKTNNRTQNSRWKSMGEKTRVSDSYNSILRKGTNVCYVWYFLRFFI